MPALYSAHTVTSIPGQNRLFQVHLALLSMPSNNTSPVFFYNYVLQSTLDGKHYVRYTKDLRHRLEEHRKKHVISTKHRGHLQLIYYEACLDELDAKQREKYLKTTAGRRFLAKRLRRYKLTTAGIIS